MTNTAIKVEISLYSDYIDFDTLNAMLDIKPSNYWVKGDKVTKMNILRKESCWEYQTNYIETYDLKEIINREVKPLFYAKVDEIKVLQTLYALNAKISVVVKVYNNTPPSLFLESEFLKFISAINAEIDIDLYLHS